MRSYWIYTTLLILFSIAVVCGPAKAGAPSAPGAPVLNLQESHAPDDLDYLDDLDDLEEEIVMDGTVADPLRPLNRVFFEFNDKVYLWVLEPVGKGYRAVVPRLARKSVRNFFTNITSPVRFVNAVLQGKGEAAGIEFSSFLVNSTVGILGLTDPAAKLVGKRKDAEDLGQTMGHYGMGNGFYLVLPLLGPSTLRDTAGLVGDYFLTPQNYVEGWEMRTGLRALDTVNTTSFRIGDYKELKDAAIVPYEAFRDAYIQNRKKRVDE